MWAVMCVCHHVCYTQARSCLSTGWALNRCFAWFFGTAVVLAQGGGRGMLTPHVPRLCHPFIAKAGVAPPPCPSWTGSPQASVGVCGTRALPRPIAIPFPAQGPGRDRRQPLLMERDLADDTMTPSLPRGPTANSQWEGRGVAPYPPPLPVHP